MKPNVVPYNPLSLFSAIATFFLLLTPGARADCYTHNGVLARDARLYVRGGPELVSCGKGTNNCCLRGSTCGTNLLCYLPDGYITREYCADPSWTNCSAIAPEFYESGVYLTHCGANVFTYDTGTCETGPLHLVDPESGQIYDPAVRSNTAPVSTWSVESLSILSAASTATSVSATSLPLTAAFTTSDRNTLATPAQTSSPSASTSSNSSSALSAGAGAGIGVGCAAAIAIIGSLVWLLLRERKRRKVLQQQQQPPMDELEPVPKDMYAHIQPPQELEDRPHHELEGASRSEAP